MLRRRSKGADIIKIFTFFFLCCLYLYCLISCKMFSTWPSLIDMLCHVMWNLFNVGSIHPADTNVFKTSSGGLKKVTTSCDQTRHRQDVLQKTFDLKRLENVRFTTSWRRLTYVVLKTSDLRRLEDVQFTTSWRHLIYVSSWRCPIYDVLKTFNLWRLEDVRFTTSWRRL